MFRRAAVVMIGLAALIAQALPAQAHVTGRFTCRASVVRVVGEGPLAGLAFEPIVANAQNDPCVAEEAGIGRITLPADLGEVSVLFAQTETTRGQNASSRAGVADVVITVPGAPVITVEVLTAEAAATCPGPEFSGGSTVVGLTIGGVAVEVPAGHTDISLGPVGTLHLNESTTTTTEDPAAGRTERQALFLDTNLVDIVIAEAVADFQGNPCKTAP